MPSSDVEAAAADDGKQTVGAGAATAIEPKGTWWQAGFHMTTATLGPASLSLPYALRGLGWAMGLAALTAVAAVTFYAYFLVSRVLDRCEATGRRHARFRDLAADVLGSRWATCLVVTVQVAINVGISIGSILLAADCLELTYSRHAPNGSLKLYHFVIMVAVVLAVLSQLPSLHSLRHINVGSMVISIGYTMLVSAACICAGLSRDAPAKDYSLSTSRSEKTFTAFLSVSILTSVFGNSILPEIQATLAPPAGGKMTRALVLSYSVFVLAFYSPAVAGYWAFGNQVRSNVMQSLLPADTGSSLAPPWMLGLAVVLILLQLIAIALVYLQVTYEMMEKNLFSNKSKGRRLLLAPRVALRAAYVAALAFVAAMLPFFGEIQGVVGSVGYIPLDVVIPVVMYNMALAPRRRSPAYVANVAIMVAFVGLGVIGAVASVRKLVLNADKFKLFSNGRS
ncbi:hypothetical protein SETIT_7G058900v2 [Setaria italica]|uniref:Amino acid transporter transmembrane domain-containing protein n=1 Tax=Setaria italica TaxID=4555 RepID=K3Y785_SETIT|nr:probable GABA transporter 2 [Setaria italica]RCV33146.1 hypothetical protein SETIT_7G058900v2 [Setaria italica]